MLGQRDQLACPIYKQGWEWLWPTQGKRNHPVSRDSHPNRALLSCVSKIAVTTVRGPWKANQAGNGFWIWPMLATPSMAGLPMFRPWPSLHTVHSTFLPPFSTPCAGLSRPAMPTQCRSGNYVAWGGWHTHTPPFPSHHRHSLWHINDTPGLA